MARKPSFSNNLESVFDFELQGELGGAARNLPRRAQLYPSEYPEDGYEAVVTGRFEIYEENGSNYVHPVEASLQEA